VDTPSPPFDWSPGALKRLFRARGFQTTRKLGQHLLLDAMILEGVADAGAPEPGDLVLEVGTGPGMLTRMLLRYGVEVLGVELDPRALALIRELLGDEERLQLVEGDVLDGPRGLHPEVVARLARAGREGQRVLCISNFPYHIATPLIVRLLELGLVGGAFPLVRIAGTVQREVAERLAAGPADRRTGAASVLVQALSRIQVVRRLAPGAFWPPPKVESAVIRIDPLPPGQRLAAGDPDSWGRFQALVRTVFRYRRKTLRNALRQGFPGAPADRILEGTGLDGGARTESVCASDLARLSGASEWGVALDV
jgi:16S rRNA (adenine1518-N6/adenine1519-N6)-dimethyltransferase